MLSMSTWINMASMFLMGLWNIIDSILKQPEFSSVTSLFTLLLGGGFVVTHIKNQPQVKVLVKRDEISPYAKQYPEVEILLFQAVNESPTNIVANEYGIIIGKDYINLVDMAWSHLLPEEGKYNLGSLVHTSLPGCLLPQIPAIARFSFSGFQTAYVNITNREELQPEAQGYIASMNLVNSFKKIKYDTTENILVAKPYVRATTGKLFIGEKTKIKLGNLHHSVDLRIPECHPSSTFNQLGIKVKS